MPICNQCKKFSNCLTIDSCEHCGAKDWIPPKQVSAITSAQSKKDWGCTVAVIVLAFLGVWAYDAVYDAYFKPDKEVLSEQFHLSKDRVYAQPKPHGCAYNDAPLGDKHCHYEKHIIVYSKDGLVIEKDGNRVQQCPSCLPWSAEVTWEKIEE
jgi:hypothetical protein